MKKIFVLLFILLPVLSNATMLGTRPLLRAAAQNQVRFDSSISDTLNCSNSIWNEFVNRACMQVAQKTNCVRRVKSVVSVAGTSVYFVNDSLLEIQSVMKNVSKTSRPLKHLPAAVMREATQDTALSAVQSPKAFWVEGDSLHLYPTPNNAVDTFVVGYSVWPVYLDGDAWDSSWWCSGVEYDTACAGYDSIVIDILTYETNIPEPYREPIVFYTCFLFLSRIRAYEAADYWFKQYDARIKEHQMQDATVYDLPKGGG